MGHFSLQPLPKKPSGHGCVQSTPVHPETKGKSIIFHYYFKSFVYVQLYLCYKYIGPFVYHTMNCDSICILVGNLLRKIRANTSFRSWHLTQIGEKIVLFVFVIIRTNHTIYTLLIQQITFTAQMCFLRK